MGRAATGGSAGSDYGWSCSLSFGEGVLTRLSVLLGLVFGSCLVAMETETLAAKLGTTTHLSPLLRKARRLGLGARDLERLAIQRGCDYYHNGEPFERIEVSPDQFSNAELAIALLNPALGYDPQMIRLGAAMLSAEGTDPEQLARLAKMERCEALVRYIAEAGMKFEPRNSFWGRLLDFLPHFPEPKSGVFPHPTRFVAMTGFTRRGPETIVEWIRPSSSQLGHGHG